MHDPSMGKYLPVVGLAIDVNDAQSVGAMVGGCVGSAMTTRHHKLHCQIRLHEKKDRPNLW